MDNNEKLAQANQELKQRQINVIKEVIRLTFEKIDSLEAAKHKLQEEIKILKYDLFDLKDGRLDRIFERQETNDSCKTISVITVCRVVTDIKEANHWYINYDVSYITPDGVKDSTRINNSISKLHSTGTYKLKNGTIRYL